MKDAEKGITWTKIQGRKVIFKINTVNLGVLFFRLFSCIIYFIIYVLNLLLTYNY